MLITIEKLAQKIKCSVPSLKIYLCRAEFAHIHWKKVEKNTISNNVHAEDIVKLRKLVFNRGIKSGKLYAVR